MEWIVWVCAMVVELFRACAPLPGRGDASFPSPGLLLPGQLRDVLIWARNLAAPPTPRPR